MANRGRTPAPAGRWRDSIGTGSYGPGPGGARGPAARHQEPPVRLPSTLVSNRKRKKQAQGQGLTEPELRMVELLEELVDGVRWLQVLGWSNQFTLQQKLKLSDAERDHILEAAARAVDADGRARRWQQDVSRLKGEISAGRCPTQ